MNEPALRIFHLFRAPVGGLFRHVVDLATEQARAGHQVGVICDSTTGGAHEDAILAALKPHLALGLHRIPMRRQISPMDAMAVHRAHRLLTPLNVDVMHGHGAKGGVLARVTGTRLARGRPVARVYTPHGGSLHYSPSSTSGRVYFAAERLLERITDGIIHVSDYEAGLYAAKVQPPRCIVRVIPNGLREDEFVPIAPPANARDVLFLGAFRDIKGIDVLLEALTALKQSGEPLSAILVGQPDGRAAYETMAHERGLEAEFRDPMPARAAFATARAIAVPSRAESMPYVVLEAIAAGLPIVATNVGGIPEIFGPRAGELVPAGDPAALTTALRRIFADPQRAVDDAAARRAFILPRFNVNAMARDTLALYRDIVAAPAAAPRAIGA